jgi:ribonuclease-3
MTRRRREAEDLEAKLGYRFADPSLLEEALTHASAGPRRDNQRLEFLGDALLNFAVALLLHQERPDWQEGSMSKLRGALVRTESLYRWAMDLGLDQALKASHPRKAPAMGQKPLADAMEALLAAIFLDARALGQNGTAVVQALVERRFLDSVRQARPETLTGLDPKTCLQETAARMSLPAPVYTQEGQTGPGHAPRFAVRVSVGPHEACAEGSTRKRAEGEAAQRLLDTLGKRPES